MTDSATQAAAAERGTRSLWQGLGIDLAVAVAVVLLAWLPDADLASSTAWVILGTAVAKSILTAAASYVMRLKMAPAREVAARTVSRHVETGAVDGRLVGTIVLAVVLAWLVITVLELVIR